VLRFLVAAKMDRLGFVRGHFIGRHRKAVRFIGPFSVGPPRPTAIIDPFLVIRRKAAHARFG